MRPRDQDEPQPWIDLGVPQGPAGGFGSSSVDVAAAAFNEDPLCGVDQGVAGLDPQHV